MPPADIADPEGALEAGRAALERGAWAEAVAAFSGVTGALPAADPRAAEAWETHLRDGLEVEPQVLAGMLARARELGTPLLDTNAAEADRHLETR